MKKLFTLLVVIATIQSVFANSGIYETYLSTSLNGGGEIFYGTGGSNPTFQGKNLGTISSMSNTLVFKLRGMNSFNDNGSDVSAGSFLYRVYKQGSAAPAFTDVSLTQQGSSGNNKFWNNNSPDINILASASTTGTYNVEIYFRGSTNAVNTVNPILADNGGAYFVATFVSTVVLAAELTFFKANRTKDGSLISWLTASEKDNALFQIERASNGTNFSPIGEVKGQGNSTAAKNYTFTDVAPLSGVNYYRLKAIDYNGAATLSKVVSVNFSGKNDAKIAVYPNPTRDVLRVDVNAADASTTTVQITDLMGRVVLSQQIAVNKGANLLPLNVASLPSGAYFVKVNADVTRFVKQ